MSETENLISIQIANREQSWFDANPNYLLLKGQSVELGQTGLYKTGDGTTLLSSLNWLGIQPIIDASYKYYAFYNFS